MPSTKTKITQPLADRAAGEFDPGHIVLDSEVAGLRIVVGKSSASWKLVGSIGMNGSTNTSSKASRRLKISPHNGSGLTTTNARTWASAA